MKRHRFLNFWIDTTRNLINDPNQPKALVEIEKARLMQSIGSTHGIVNVEEKLQRYLEFNPPNFCVLTEYHLPLLQVQDSYVSGYDYTALTGACCLGERILNLLVIKLKHYHKQSNYYKRVNRNASIQHWDVAIDALSDWGVLKPDISNGFKKLEKLRNASVHYGPLNDVRPRALSSLLFVTAITDELFGLRPDVFFNLPGESYIRHDMVGDPLVREFFIPNCPLVGYKHFLENVATGLMIRDNFDYEPLEVDDDEFRRLREDWQKQPHSRD